MNATQSPPKRRAKREGGQIYVTRKQQLGSMYFVALLDGVRSQSLESADRAALKAASRAYGAACTMALVETGEDSWTYRVTAKQEDLHGI